MRDVSPRKGIEKLRNLELTEDQAEAALDFLGRAVAATPSMTCLRIARDIVEDTLRSGACRVSHAEFCRRTGKARRTVDNALKHIQRVGLVEKIERTSEGRSVYRAIIGGASVSTARECRR